jgi:hypothetical protein
MHIDLSRDDAETLRETLQVRVRELDVEINKTDSLRYKDALRETERRLERILGAVTMAMEPAATGAADWEPRDTVSDTDGTAR